MKKSLRPKQTAPVQRENTSTTMNNRGGGVWANYTQLSKFGIPFAGDDAE